MSREPRKQQDRRAHLHMHCCENRYPTAGKLDEERRQVTVRPVMKATLDPSTSRSTTGPRPVRLHRASQHKTQNGIPRVHAPGGSSSDYYQSGPAPSAALPAIDA
ncbi:hypothetical protein ACCO45_004361 [Purpureocillium lilacinum]|uniref:Uncharacterized protein n=1 Tax=Purpureocillium lilacinum TaxID=33203 RepID=A0ACC4E3M6_PURLI